MDDAGGSFTLEIATPERLVVNERVSEAQIPGLDGYMGVLPGHAPLISELANGILSYTSDQTTHYLSVYGGFVEILADRVRVLADFAEKKEEIDLVRAREELKRAFEVLEDPPVDLDPANALAEMQRAQARVDLASQSSHG
ncbi:MAG: ATP synthase F1 subunit epsilon [Acidobacteriota bacterium]|nr:ATP synthase F1 subunit epsilon [Acidobacteriota bacterium]